MKKFLSYLLILSFLFTWGCGQKSNDYPFIKQETREILNFITYSNNITPILYSDVSDEEYALPTKEWVNNKFTPYYKNFLFKNYLNTFKEGQNDCDKYANYALTCGFLLFNEEKDMEGTGLAIGVFEYFYNLQRHVIIFFIVNDNGPKMLFYEPQVQQFFELNKEQKETLCTSWRM